MLLSFETVSLEHYLILSAVLFSVGLLTLLLRRNLLVLLMGVELLLNAINLSLLAFSNYQQDVNGQILVFFMMTIAAAEAAVALSLAVTIFKSFKSVDISNLERLRG